MSDKNGNGFKLRFTTPQIITIVILIITMVVALTSKADKSEVNRIKTSVQLIEQKQDLQYQNIIERLDRIEKKVETDGP